MVEKNEKGYLPLIKHEWFLGGVAGVIATIIGFLLTMWWDVHKEAKEEAEKSMIVYRLFDDEFKENEDIVKRNIQSLSEELRLLSQKLHVVEPLSVFRTGARQLAIVLTPDNPKKIEKLGGLRYLLTQINICNEEIASRENFRLHNQPLSNYLDQMRLYDEKIIADLQIISDLLQANSKSLDGLLEPGQKPEHIQ